MPKTFAQRLAMTAPLLLACAGAHATEGALGRPVTGTSVVPNAGVVSPEPALIVNVGEIYLDGSIGGSRTVPIAGKASVGIDGKIAFTLATVMKVWDTDTGAWNFASSFTLPYVWTKVTANLAVGGRGVSTQDTTSNLFDISFAPVIAGYHFSRTEHVALSLNVWAPTGKYDPNALANPSLNNWTFIPQVAYTRLFPEHGLEFDAVAGIQFYTRNHATDYQNAPLFTLDTMLLKRFANGAGVGLIAGTTQQLGDDSGPLADRLNGFRGHDWAVGPIVTYDTKVGAKSLLSLGLRWVPSVASKNRLKSTNTFMGTATLVF
ncbi:SphA family protein [Cupriavidus alkaliphilus]|uniref:SphA family protein n=1 Tax=Cupriavidus alkaliphilus TaxID=942866 RepID=UPI001614F45C|nr:transporter [Cupriavidus alkaliphilus]